MDLRIKGKRALIFGGSRGIGRAVTGALAAEGVDVAVCAHKEWAAKKVAAEAMANSGVRAKGYRIDAWDELSTIALVNGIMDDFGAIDILFGIARRSVLEDRNALTPSGWHTHFDKGFLRFKAVTETILPGMRERHWGRILWMIPRPTAGTRLERQLYSVVSAAVVAWLESVASDFAKDNVILSLLTPAPVSRTTRSTALHGRGNDMSGSVSVADDTTLAIAQAASIGAFLLSDHAAGTCGKTIELGIGSLRRLNDNSDVNQSP